MLLTCWQMDMMSSTAPAVSNTRSVVVVVVVVVVV